MKYLLFLTALSAAFNGAFSQANETMGFGTTEAPEVPETEAPTEEEKGPIGTVIDSLLNTTGNWFQNVSIPDLGSGAVLTTLACDQATYDSNQCDLVGGLTGVNVCRTIAGFDITLCAPKIFDQYIGSSEDECGCCGGSCLQNTAASCLCSCQEGEGVLVAHNLFSIFGRQVTWNACYTPTIAESIMVAREEFTCSNECPAAVAALAAAEAEVPGEAAP